jgi:elongation factor G
VKIHLYPGVSGAGYIFDNDLIDHSIPTVFIKSIEEDIREALTRGVLSSYPIDDVRIALYAGSYHEVDSSDTAFRIAGSMAFQDAAKKARPMLLEPVMRVEVVAPNDDIGDVTSNLAHRRGQIFSQEDRGGAAIVAARIPLSEMLGYATDLRSRTQGRATYSMFFESYEPLHGGPECDEEDLGTPVRAPRTPGPRGKDFAVALPEPDDEGPERP